MKGIESNKSPFKDIDDKFSGITVISRKQNTVKGIESNKKNHYFEAEISSKLLSMLLVLVLFITG